MFNDDDDANDCSIKNAESSKSKTFAQHWILLTTALLQCFTLMFQSASNVSHFKTSIHNKQHKILKILILIYFKHFNTTTKFKNFTNFYCDV